MNALLGYCQYWGRGLFHGGGLFMGLIPVLLFITLFILGIFFLKKWSQKNSEDTAFEILKKQYAKGLINKDEFELKKKDPV